MNWFLVLTPLLLLPILFLLAFVGCGPATEAALPAYFPQAVMLELDGDFVFIGTESPIWTVYFSCTGTEKNDSRTFNFPVDFPLVVVPHMLGGYYDKIDSSTSPPTYFVNVTATCILQRKDGTELAPLTAPGQFKVGETKWVFKLIPGVWEMVAED
jgi:hypothetical protein